MNATDAEILALVREIVEEYDSKANANIPTYVLVDALEGTK